MRRLALLIAVGATWLFLAALPALADGGPHVASVNNGTSSLTADSCAGCHRVHTAQGPMLLKTSSEETLCVSCHGAASTGATTDVITGVQYVPAANGTRTATELGALRGGGFEEARIGDPFRYTVSTGATTSARLGKVQVASNAGGTATVAEAVNSAHMPGLAGLTQPGIAWGNGANGSGAGPSVTLGCASCHNPHGNNQYRILKTFAPSDAAPSGINPAWIVDIATYTDGVYVSDSSMGVLNGDTVSVTGNTFAAANATGTITMVDGPDSGTTPDDNRFTLSGVTAVGAGTGGQSCKGTWGGSPLTCTPSGTKVTDSPVDPDGNPANGVENPTKNYTVIQVQGTPGNLSTYWLYARQVTSGPTSGDYFHYRVPWNGTSGTTLDAPNGVPGGTVFTGGFGEQVAAWCATCHTRYWAWSEPTEDPADPDGTVGPAYSNARPGDSIFTYQHRTRGASGRGCLTCHVSHGSNAQMTEANSANFTFPNGTASNNSRLLKVDNRGTCQQCHDPTGTSKVGDQYPPAPYPVPGTP